MHIGVVVRRRSGSARVRALQHVPRWEEAGHRVEVLAWDAPAGAALATRSREVLALAARADVLLLQKPVLPSRLMASVERTNPRLVADLDDAVWVEARGIRRTDPARLARLHETLRRSRALVVGSDYLARRLTELGPVPEPTLVLRPSTPVATHRVAPVRAATRPLRVGWIGNPGNFGDLHDDLRAALAEQVDAGAVEFVVISGRPFADPVLPTEFVAWSEETEQDALAGLDVGIMPLVDDERSRGRCGFKVVQYQAAGLPVIASPVGSAPELIEHGRTGLLASDPTEWRTALAQLADPAERARLGQAGRASVAHLADATATADALAELLEAVASQPRWWRR